MILKKPYAFLIKHFKLIHIVMTILFGYLIYQTNMILNFLNRYMSSKQIVTGKDLVDPLFSMAIYIVLGVIILLCIVIVVLMNFKKKPFSFYFANIIISILLIIIYYFAQTTIGVMETKVVDLQTIRLIRDFLTIAILLQTFSVVVAFIRGIGFNIKQFNFEEDYHELNIDSKDNEEFELELSIDTSKFRRNWRKRKRHFKYTYAEHKYIINLVILLLILVLVFAISFVVGLFDKKYKQGELFTTDNYIMGIDNSYLVTKDYKGKIIKEGSKFIVLELNAKNKYNNDNKFVVASSNLIIGEEKFYHDRNYIEEFSDLGNVYLDQTLTTEATKYLLVYELPIDLECEEVTFNFKDSVSQRGYNVKINLQNLEEKTDVKDIKLGDPLVIDNHIKTKIQINEYALARNFRLDYQFCVTKDECYNSVEYLYPTLSGRTNKALLKLNGTINLEENHISGIKNLSNFINYFGVIEYEMNGQVKKQESGFKRVKPNNVKSSDYYIEINEEVISADKIYLDFIIRNNTYRYQLK